MPPAYSELAEKHGRSLESRFYQRAATESVTLYRSCPTLVSRPFSISALCRRLTRSWQKNTDAHLNHAFINGLQLSQSLYTEAVQPLLAVHFPSLPYAAGLLGAGRKTRTLT